MNEEERKATLAEIEVKKKELATLKATLDELHANKEAWFEKKRKATAEISDVVKSIRDAKGKRNTFTKQVRDSKSRRSELNTLLKNKLDELKKLQQEKKTVSQKFGMRFDPSKIQQEIEELEFRIETEAIPFKIEQQMMKKIAERKKVLEQSKEVSDVFDKIHALRKDIDKIRKKADDTHKKVQTKAEASQQFHEELVESSKDIKEVRDKEEDALKKFVEAKNKYMEQNELVKAKQQEIAVMRAKVDGVNLEEKKKAKKADEKKIQDQKQSVEEKIQKGLKLTTEDLLAFQAKEQAGGGVQIKKKPAKKPKKKEEKNEGDSAKD